MSRGGQCVGTNGAARTLRPGRVTSRTGCVPVAASDAYDTRYRVPSSRPMAVKVSLSPVGAVITSKRPPVPAASVRKFASDTSVTDTP